MSEPYERDKDALDAHRATLTDHDTVRSKCAHCGHPFSGRGADGGVRPPRPGDASLCINCGEIGIFRRNMTVRKATPKERREAIRLPGVIETQILIKSRRDE